MTRYLCSLTLVAFLLAPASALADDVYWTSKSLLKDFFKTSKRVSYVKLKTAHAAEELKTTLGYVPPKGTYVVFVGRTEGKIDGYAVIDEQMGQHQPITFGVKMDAQGQVQRMEVMVYREGQGDEIREARFRRQFSEKTPDDSIRLGEDIVAISGATISSKSMAIGVRRAVAIVQAVRTQTSNRAHASAGIPARSAP